MEDKVLVTIVIATYNRQELISESLKAILNQNFKDWECLVIDDGSNDDTIEIVERFERFDRRIKYYKRLESYKKGISGCRNFGLDLAKGNFVTFMDDDDIPHPQLLELSLEEFKNSSIHFCRYLRATFKGDFKYDFEKINAYQSNSIDIQDLDAIITGKIPFNSCQVMWSRDCFEKNRFNEDLMFAEEWECYSRVLSNEKYGKTLDKVLYFARKHPNSNTGEYKQNNLIRKNSKIEAAILIIENLSAKNLLKPSLMKFFIRLSLELKSRRLLKLILQKSNLNYLRKIIYSIGFEIYPAIRPIFKFKAKYLEN